MSLLKYNIGDKVKCHINLNLRLKGIRRAESDDIIEDFEIVGRNINATGPEYHYYLKALNKDIAEDPRFGFILSESFVTAIFCYEIPKDIIGKSIIGCYEENILEIKEAEICEKCKHEIKERELFLTKYKGCWC